MKITNGDMLMAFMCVGSAVSLGISAATCTAEEHRHKHKEDVPCDRVGSSDDPGERTSTLWDEEFRVVLNACITRGVEENCFVWSEAQVRSSRKGCR